MPSTKAIYEGMKWAHENGSYVLRNSEGLVVLRTKEPTVLFNQRTGQLLRSGDRERIVKLAAKMRADLIRIDNIDQARDIVMLTSRSFSVKELNLCLGEPGYCAVLYRRLAVQ